MRLVPTFLAACALALGLSSSGWAQEAEEAVRVTRHAITLQGRPLRYTARAGRLPIRHNETGEVRGQMFFVSYTREDVRGPRPVTFVWNGGPGSNAALVHLVGFGPRRIVPPRDGRKGIAWSLEHNPDTWLTETDLVFVDPIGTGYSRPVRAEYGKDFYSNRGDAESVAEFIRVYRTRFDAHEAPLFLAGESFGVTRAAGVAAVLHARGIAVRGAILIGLALPLGSLSESQRQAFSLPTLAAAAHAHGKQAPDLPRDLETLLRGAEEFAASDYAGALERLAQLPEAEHDRVAQVLSRYTGLEASSINRTTLNPGRMQLGNALLRREGRVVGQYDSRVTGPLDTTQAMYDPTKDPSLDGLTDGVAIVRYFRNELGYASDLQYQGPFGGGYPSATAFRADWMSLKWSWPPANAALPPWPPGVPRPPIDAPQPLQAVMELDPTLRVFSACGIYDLVCDYFANEWVARTLPDDLRHRVVVQRYAGGHALYTDPAVHPRFARDVMAFIRATLADRHP